RDDGRFLAVTGRHQARELGEDIAALCLGGLMASGAVGLKDGPHLAVEADGFLLGGDGGGVGAAGKGGGDGDHHLPENLRHSENGPIVHDISVPQWPNSTIAGGITDPNGVHEPGASPRSEAMGSSPYFLTIAEGAEGTEGTQRD